MSAEISAPRPVSGRLSAAFAVLAVAAPIVIGFVFVGTEQARPAPARSGPEAYSEGWAWLGRLIVAFAFAALAAGLFALGGVVSAAVALARGERPSWPAWFGLCVCAPIVVLLLAAVAGGQR